MLIETKYKIIRKISVVLHLISPRKKNPIPINVIENRNEIIFIHGTNYYYLDLVDARPFSIPKKLDGEEGWRETIEVS